MAFPTSLRYPLLALGLTLFPLQPGCQTTPTPARDAAQLQRAIAILENPDSPARDIAAAEIAYRRIANRTLRRAQQHAGNDPVIGDFIDLIPVPPRPRPETPALHRAGVGLPLIGHLPPARSNSPRRGFHVPLTALARVDPATPDTVSLHLVDPRDTAEVQLANRPLPVAMDLEAPLDATRATGPGRFSGMAFMLFTDRFPDSRLIFLEPYDPAKIPVVLVHGLMSTPQMWEPVIKGLLADPAIRKRYQFWMFYYPTGQPIPLSAWQLRDSVDAAVARFHVRTPLVLVGHSMGGILSRVQVSQFTPKQANALLAGVSDLPPTSLLRRALIFEPRRDVNRVVFLATPHRGTNFAHHAISRLGIHLIRLPLWLESELSDFAAHLTDSHHGRLPTSIHGLSPRSRFLAILSESQPTVPTHTLLGTLGNPDLPNSSDGIVPYESAHLPFAQSEFLVPAGHGLFREPTAIAELHRILTLPD